MDVPGDGPRAHWDCQRPGPYRGRDEAGAQGPFQPFHHVHPASAYYPISFLSAIPQETILSPTHDPFFSNHLFSNFGDLGASLATYVKEFQAKSLASNPSAIETVADMKRFVEEYPEFKKLGGNVSKHVALVGELSRIVERDDLLAVSELEQSLASNESHTSDLKVRIASPPFFNGIFPES